MILGLLLNAALYQKPIWLPDAWLERQGYQRIDVWQSGDHVQAEYRNLSALSQISVDLYVSARRQDKKFNLQEQIDHGESFGYSNLRVGLPSGMPLGTEVRTLPSPPWKRLMLMFRTEWASGTIQATWGDDKRKAFIIPEGADKIGEGLARQVLARAESQRLTHEGRKTLGAREVSTSGTQETELVDLSEWAKARGWALKTDDCVATLTKGEHKLRIPLGALAVEIDGKWIDLPEVVMLKDYQWWVPLDALESATKD